MRAADDFYIQPEQRDRQCIDAMLEAAGADDPFEAVTRNRPSLEGELPAGQPLKQIGAVVEEQSESSPCETRQGIQERGAKVTVARSTPWA
jgi:hypothetical protein